MPKQPPDEPGPHVDTLAVAVPPELMKVLAYKYPDHGALSRFMIFALRNTLQEVETLHTLYEDPQLADLYKQADLYDPISANDRMSRLEQARAAGWDDL